MNKLFCIILAEERDNSSDLNSILLNNINHKRNNGNLDNPLLARSQNEDISNSTELSYSLFQKTFLNMTNLVNDKDIVTISGIKQFQNVKNQLKELQDKFSRNIEYKIVIEPVQNGTTSSITLASKYIKDNCRYFDEQTSLILVIPYSNFFKDREILTQTIQSASILAENGYIVAFGTKSSAYDENKSYFKIRKHSLISELAPEAYKVSQFIYNKSKKQLKEFKDSKLYSNTGIYMFSFNTYMQELQKYSKDAYLNIINKKITSNIPSIDLNEYQKMPNVSIEESIISNAKKLAFLNLETQWTNVNNFESFYEISPKDINNNYCAGNVLNIDSKNSILCSYSDKSIVTVGINDMMIVNTDNNTTYITERKSSENLKKLYKKIKEKDLLSKTQYKPWGYYTILESEQGYLTKCLNISPNAQLSLQKHAHRSEHWIVLDGEATIRKGDKTLTLNSGQSIDIELNEIHSIQNRTKKQLKILEVQFGDIIDETDIERIEDIYGRV